MVSQAKAGCKNCKKLGHTISVCPSLPRKAIKKSSIKRKPAKPVVKKKKTETRSQVVKKLDTVFSQYIRQKDAVNGIATCVTCGDQKEWKHQQNGHYMSRGHYGTRWDETNCHVQCAACNVFKKGNYTEYALYMINRYGTQHLEDLRVKAKTSTKFTTFELREMLEYYKKML